MTGTILIDQERCKSCKYCVEFCFQGIIQISKESNPLGVYPAILVDPENKCTGCSNCALVCPEAAITVYRKKRGEK